MENGLHIRVDNRLLHGQVVQYWLPFLEVDRLIIADDDAASNPAMTAVYRMAVPKRVDLAVVPVEDLLETLQEKKATTTMVLVGDVFDAARAKMCGLSFKRLVIGNVHAAEGRDRITDSVYLSPEEVASLVEFKKAGGAVEIQTFPGERLRLEVDEDGEPKWSRR